MPISRNCARAGSPCLWGYNLPSPLRRLLLLNPAKPMRLLTGGEGEYEPMFSDLRLRRGVLEDRTRCGEYQRIDPDKIRDAAEIDWWTNMPRVAVTTEDATFTVSPTRADYDDIVDWVCRNSNFKLDRTFAHKYTKAVWRAPIHKLLGHLVAFPFRVVRLLLQTIAGRDA